MSQLDTITHYINGAKVDAEWSLERFYIDKPAGTHLTMMEIDDAEHYTPEQRAKIIASYPAHERKARTKGIPQLGSGRVFPIDEDEIRVVAVGLAA